MAVVVWLFAAPIELTFKRLKNNKFTGRDHG
jgi:hypothetical protein